MTTRSCQPQEAKEFDVVSKMGFGYELNFWVIEGLFEILI